LPKILHIEDAFAALQGGDERGLAFYFNQFYSRLFYFSHSITGSDAASEDIVSDCFIKLWDNRRSLKQESHVKHFLYLIARNSSINYLREQKKERQKENILIQLTPLNEKHVLEKLIEAETYKELYQIYARLPKKCRTIFEMFYIERKPIKEIAKELSVSVNTVKSQKQRALQLLREYKAEQNLLFVLCLVYVCLG
jgi:RNA polymerase sigma-70 factor (ECF subfamily)